MPTEQDAAELRRRAVELYRLAAHLAATPLDELATWSGPETWVSPRAVSLHIQLGIDRARLHAAVDDLRRHAHWLDRQAEAAEASVAAMKLAALGR